MTNAQQTRITLPTLLSSKQVAEAIGIHRKNMQAKRKTKGFPKPITVVDGFPLWLESDITTWMEAKRANDETTSNDD